MPADHPPRTLGARIWTSLSGLDPEQRAVAETLRGPVCVLAGAGTGKTRAITHRIAHAVQSRYRRRAQRAGCDVHHPRRRRAPPPAARARRARRPGAHLPRRRAAPAHLLLAARHRRRPAPGDRVEAAAADRGGPHAAPQPGPRRAPRRRQRDRVGQGHPARPEDYPAAAAKARRTPPIPAEELARLFDQYEKLRRARHLVDFETILELTAAVMTEHREVANQIRSQYRYFVVDEYQDVNPLQKLLLDTWLGGRDDVCVVGDPNQTIYSFTGASPHFLTSFGVEHPERGRGQAGPRLPLRPRGGRAGQPGDGPQPPPPGAGRPARAGPRTGLHRIRRRTRRGAGRRAAGQEADGRRRPRPGDRRACSG